MTPEEFNRLPELLTRADLRELGFKDHAIDDLRFEVRHPNEAVPWGRIGAVRGLRGKRRERHGGGYFFYLRATVARLMGGGYQ